MITAVVGAGGKTSLIRQLAAEERAAGRSVLVTTTTHMFIEGDTLCTGDPQPILTRLRETGYAMAGIPQGPKITALPPETYEILCREAHTVLVEADGSRHMALKFPGPGEPVIPENADRILVVCGLHALGQKVTDCCHRPELVTACLGIDPDTPITPRHIGKLMEEGYLKPLRRRYPDKEILLVPRHDGSPGQQAIAADLVKSCQT